jgi:hypothetical protein
MLRNLKLRICQVGLITAALLSVSCQTGAGQVIGNENGSSPANMAEVPEYKRAVLRCYKTGGSRVVKIEGRLRCF